MPFHESDAAGQGQCDRCMLLGRAASGARRQGRPASNGLRDASETCMPAGRIPSAHIDAPMKCSRCAGQPAVRTSIASRKLLDDAN